MDIKVMKLQETIKRILREEASNEFRFFRRRVDLEKVKKVLPINAQEVYYETKNYEQFMQQLMMNTKEIEYTQKRLLTYLKKDQTLLSIQYLEALRLKKRGYTC